MTKPKLNKPPAMDCPHCGSGTDIRTSKGITRTYREVSYRCQNDDCGCIFVAALEAIRVIVPSATPHPEISLPFSTRARLGVPPKPANDDMPPAANDDAMTDTG
ncbi:MAG: ogr/Delta-like zinc finger family protein [Rhizorhabdus sp.]